MDFKRNRNLFIEAVNSGCKTVAEFAMFLRARESILAL